MRILQTVLNLQPIVSRFSVYGAPIECGFHGNGEATSIAIPAFILSFLVILCILLYCSYSLDVKDRWKVHVNSLD